MSNPASSLSVSFKNPVDGSVRSIQVSEDEFVLDAAEMQGEELPYSCRSGGCLTCTAKLLEGEAHMSEEQYGLEDEDIQQGFRLLCCTKVSSACVFLTHQMNEI